MDNREPVISVVRWAQSQILTLTHFSVLAAVLVHCCAGNLLLVVTAYSIGVAAVLACLCLHLFARYYEARKTLSSIEHDVRQAQKWSFELEKAQNRERVYKRAFESIKECMECSITCEVPNDPVVTSTGFVFSKRALDAWMSEVGYYTCPRTRMLLNPSDIVRVYPVINVCAEVQYVEDMIDKA